MQPPWRGMTLSSAPRFRVTTAPSTSTSATRCRPPFPPPLMLSRPPSRRNGHCSANPGRRRTAPGAHGPACGRGGPGAQGDYHQVARPQPPGAPACRRARRASPPDRGGATQLDGVLPSGVSLKDLGKHRLRDLLEPEQVSQVVIDGLPDHFPPLKSLERHPLICRSNRTRWSGREAELVAVRDVLMQTTCGW